MRVVVGSPDEIGFVVKPRAQEYDEAPLVARFEDGVTHAIDGVAVGHWRALAGQRRASGRRTNPYSCWSTRKHTIDWVSSSAAAASYF